MATMEHTSQEGRGFALLGRIAALAASATALEEGLGPALAEICTFTRWPIGRASIVRDGEIVGAPVWHGADDPALDDLKASTDALAARRGDGLPGRVVVSGRPCWVVDISRDATFSRGDEALRAGVKSVVALPLVAADSVVGVLELFAREEVDPDEEFLRLMSVIGVELGRMIDRARAATLIRDGEERYRLLFESATDAIFLEDTEGRIVSANPAAERLTGYLAEELRGRPVEELLAPEWREQSRAQLERKLRGKVRQTHHESVVLDRQGRRRPVEVSSALVCDNGVVVGIQSVARDLSERRRAELALRESEERFRGAFDAAAIGMTLATPDGRWLKVNDSFCRIVGYSAEELLTMRYQDITHPDDLEDDVRLGRRMLAGGFSSYQMEKRYVHKDGNTVWVHLSVSLVRDADERPVYSVAQALDITDRKRLELGAASGVRRAAGASLSPRERQVLSLLSEGQTSAETAVSLGIGEETVQTHVRRAMAKLSARTRTEAVATALRTGELDGATAVAA
jgi:PAS domain S-box-containing protein